MNDMLDQDKNFPDSSFPKLKPALTISGKIIVVIDSELVQKLQLDDENTWFYEELMDNGIFLRVRRINKANQEEMAITSRERLCDLKANAESSSNLERIKENDIDRPRRGNRCQ